MATLPCQCTHLSQRESIQLAAGLEFHLSTLLPPKMHKLQLWQATGPEEVLCALTQTHTCALTRLMHNHTCSKGPCTGLMKHEKWQHIKSQRVSAECLSDFFSQQEQIKKMYFIRYDYSDKRFQSPFFWNSSSQNCGWRILQRKKQDSRTCSKICALKLLFSI